MAFEAAIFDCDGTILDSMPMWTHECVALLERYGVENAFEVFSAHESLDMDKKCYYYHDALGIGESGEALYRELWQSVSVAYARDVKPYPGVRDFLEQVRASGIPCVIASSTPKELLRASLEAHGLTGYFDELIFCGDVGRGKEFPDVYLAAARRMGTKKENTWVFEDAPFGIRSARRAGFPVVGVLNDHDGRDADFVETWSTVVCRNFEDLSLTELDGINPSAFSALIVGGSPASYERSLIRDLARDADYVVACDSGADALVASNVVFDAYCGDMDSSSEVIISMVRDMQVRMETYDPIKDDTDLGLAMRLVEAEAERRGLPAEITMTCVSGGRPDHALGVMGVCSKFRRLRPKIVESTHTACFLSPEGTDVALFDGKDTAVLSVISLVPSTRVSEHGTYWEVEEDDLGLLSDRGVSNTIVGKTATVSCSAGCAVVFQIRRETA